jgi:hypothetical protein
VRAHFYTLDESGDPVPCHDPIAWARWFSTCDEARVVAKTELPSGVSVSTVFLGIDHAFGGGDPVLWETMSFGGDYDLACDRYRSKRDALVGHELWVLVAKGEVTPYDARRLKAGFPSAEAGEAGGVAQNKKQGKAPA